MTTDTNHYKKILEKELETVLGEIKTVARPNPNKIGEWEPIPQDNDKDSADEGDVADDIEGLQTNNAILNQLEPRMRDIKSSLQKIEEGNFGVCETCGKHIEEDRLDANPSARTCKAHMNE